MGNNVGDCPKAREDKNIYFWMTKESEEVLE